MFDDDSPQESTQRSNGHPLLNALSQFGRSFFLQLDQYPGVIPTPPENVITIWERLQHCENQEQRATKSKAVTQEGVLVRRIEPQEPIDFLEYCRRKN